MAVITRMTDYEDGTRLMRNLAPDVWDINPTIAEFNGTTQGGIVVIPGLVGFSFIPTLVNCRLTGAPGGATNIQVADEDGGVVWAYARTGMTAGTWYGSTGAAATTRLGLPTATGKGLKVQPTAADLSGSTAIRFIIVGQYIAA